jgi:hypothetical protein
MRLGGGAAMLVVTANWGCSDGTLVPGVAGRAAVRRWFAAIHRGIVRAGFRRDGRYRPVESVDVVFAGDTFDWLTSAAWLGPIRPWHGGRRARATRTAVATAAARRATPLVATVARWGREGVEVPCADDRGRPAPRGRQRVPVRVAILGGDRDAWLHDVAAEADLGACRAGRLWSDGEVLVWHGHEFDPVCRLESGDPGRPPTLAESIAVDCVAAFAATLRGRGLCAKATGRLLAPLSSVGPLELPRTLADWLETEAARGTLTPQSRRATIEDWKRAVADWHRGTDRSPPTGGLPACPLDALASWLERGADDLPAAADGRRLPAGLDDLRGPTPRELASLVAAARTSGGPTPRHAAVLGHPSGGLLVSAIETVPRLICLGASPWRRWGPVTVVDDDFPRVACVGGTGVTTPVAVAATIAAGRLEWVPLGADVRDGLETAAARMGRDRIVDAA